MSAQDDKGRPVSRHRAGENLPLLGDFFAEQDTMRQRNLAIAMQAGAVDRLADKLEEAIETLKWVRDSNVEALDRNTEAVNAMAQLRRDALRRVA